MDILYMIMGTCGVLLGTLLVNGIFYSFLLERDAVKEANQNLQGNRRVGLKRYVREVWRVVFPLLSCTEGPDVVHYIVLFPAWLWYIYISQSHRHKS